MFNLLITSAIAQYLFKLNVSGFSCQDSGRESLKVPNQNSF